LTEIRGKSTNRSKSCQNDPQRPPGAPEEAKSTPFRVRHEKKGLILPFFFDVFELSPGGYRGWDRFWGSFLVIFDQKVTIFGVFLIRNRLESTPKQAPMAGHRGGGPILAHSYQNGPILIENDGNLSFSCPIGHFWWFWACFSTKTIKTASGPP